MFKYLLLGAVIAFTFVVACVGLAFLLLNLGNIYAGLF